MSTETKPKRPPNPLMRNRNFLWLVGGGVISMLGDQFSLLAMPWLVLAVTNDTLAMGLVLGLISLPRAVFLLVGGALVDRYPARSVLLLTKYVNAVLLGGLGAGVLTGTLTIPVLCVVAFGIGLASAFSIPAGTTILPRVVPGDQLQAANGTMMGLRQATLLLGPLMAGGLIAMVGGSGKAAAGAQAPSDLAGLGAAFLVDCASFVISALTLYQVRMLTLPGDGLARKGESLGAVFRSIGDGIGHFWRDPELRALCLYFSATTFFIGGPLQAVLPVFARDRLADGADGFGLLMGLHGVGTLVGMTVSGARPNFRLRTLGATILLIDSLVALVFMPMGLARHTWQAALLMAIAGCLAGFIQIGVFTWIQRRIPPAMLGRGMSLFMFIVMSLAPLSAALCGWLMRYVPPQIMFLGSGLALWGIVALGLTSKSLRAIAMPVRTPPVAAPAETPIENPAAV
ncbi:MFS transporter [Nitrospirillum sp. BR 11163]|uniref:MFS transporter n=1 Tax=Nitrospirillum sp. BR 11163 TaxID=3104323 RepID=UPI002AFED47C|nr:MFS transporter [Nitrospirillum sp. BR 11163]MEA1674216.1 MFS transporter [Nitrospirillum sp. BR 11163]